MAVWTVDYQGTKELTGSLEEALKAFPYIEGETRDFGLDVWLQEAGFLGEGKSAEEADDAHLLQWAQSHRSSHGRTTRSPPHEWVEVSHGLQLTEEEKAMLVAMIRHWIAIR